MPTPSSLRGASLAAAQRQFTTTVSGVVDQFASKTGGETTADTSDVWDGGRRSPEKLASPAVTSNITVSRPYRPARDAPIIARLRKRVGSFRATVNVQPTDADGVAYGPPITYANALLVRIAEPEFDAASGDAAMFELEFAVETVA